MVRSALPEAVCPPALRKMGNLGLVCENLQVTGSYKVRACCHLMESRRPQRMALASSGNFAVALAWAGRHYGIPVKAVMMERSHPWKVERVRSLGASLVLCGNSTEERTARLHELAQEGWEIVDHLVDPEVLVGHATLGLDMVTVQPRQVLVPASTGGLLAATAVALKQLLPDVRVIGVQPQGSNALARSFRAGERQRVDQVVTECDALTANTPGPLPWELCRDWVDEVVEVSETSVRAAVCELVEEAKLVVEPGGAVGLAALRSGQVGLDEGTWVVLSGGNIDPQRLAHWLKGE